MNISIRRAAIAAVGVAMAIVPFGVASAQGAPTNPRALSHIPVCPGPASAGTARCNSRVIVNSKGRPQASTVPSGYGPAQLRGGYSLSGVGSVNQIVAIVDAYHDPYALSDLNTYSRTFGIPTMRSCAVSKGTTSSPCFQQVNQNGISGNYPRTDSGWALEISLDVQTVHAICQTCNVLLVEARSNSFSDLMTAEDRAVRMGATEISNSYGAGEFSGETSYDSHFNHPGVAITASSGDGGYGVEYPAASHYVTAVGGTSLYLNSDNSYQSESAWNGAGSGCSAYEPKPSAQSSVSTTCANRAVADVSADADPNTGAAVYDSVSYNGQTGWFQVGGTSLASPLIASVYALSGGVAGGVQANALPYSRGAYGINLHDVTTGSTSGCNGTALCQAGTGWDGATGLGSPLGFGAF